MSRPAPIRITIFLFRQQQQYGQRNAEYWSGERSGFDITDITGTFDGHNITGLLAPGTCCSPPNNNNVLYLSGTYLDLGGLGFSNSQGDFVNMFYWTSDSSYAVIVNDGGNIQGGGTFTLAPSAVPLPAALPMFATGLGALYLLGLHKKRKRST